MNLFNSYKKLMSSKSLQELFGLNLTAGQRTLRRDLSILRNSNPFYSCCVPAEDDQTFLPILSAQQPNVELYEFLRIFDSKNYKQVFKGSTTFDCDNICVLEFSRDGDCAHSYQNLQQEFTLTDFVPLSSLYRLFIL